MRVTLTCTHNVSTSTAAQAEHRVEILPCFWSSTHSLHHRIQPSMFQLIPFVSLCHEELVGTEPLNYALIEFTFLQGSTGNGNRTLLTDYWFMSFCLPNTAITYLNLIQHSNNGIFSSYSKNSILFFVCCWLRFLWRFLVKIWFYVEKLCDAQYSVEFRPFELLSVRTLSMLILPALWLQFTTCIRSDTCRKDVHVWIINVVGICWGQVRNVSSVILVKPPGEKTFCKAQTSPTL